MLAAHCWAVSTYLEKSPAGAGLGALSTEACTLEVAVVQNCSVLTGKVVATVDDLGTVEQEETVA